MKAVLYLRVSSQEQMDEGYSLSAQEKEGDYYAVKQSIEIVKKWSVSESAKMDNRKAFNEMIAYVKSHKDIKAILIEKPDRMTRNLTDLVKVYELIEQYDKEIHFYKQGQIIGKNSKSYEKLNLDIQVVLARQYINNLSEETKKGMYQKAAQGEFPTTAPLGYKNNRLTHLIEVDPLTAPFIKRMFELYASGNYSIDSLANKMKQDGLRARNGNPMYRSHVEKTLKNPIYYGDFIWGEKLYKGIHEPIICKELFEQVHTQLHRLNKTHQATHNFTYSGLMKCKYCGCAITAEIRKGKYIYYHCTYHKGKCGNGYIREDRLEALIVNELRRIQLSNDIQEKIIKSLKESHQNEQNFRQNAVQNLTLQYNKLQEKIDRLYDDKLEGIINTAFWQDKTVQFKKEQEDVRVQIERFEQSNSNYMETGVKILKYAQKVLELWKVPRSSDKREIFNSVFSNFTLEAKNKKYTVEPTFKKPFDILSKYNSNLIWGG